MVGRKVVTWSPVRVAIKCGGADGRAAVERRVRERGFEVSSWNEFLADLAAPMRTILDFETRADEGVSELGAWKYASQPSNEILCVAWSSRPSETGRRVLVAHNTGFEQAHLERHVPGFVLRPEEWSCTASRARRLGIPGNLEGACNVMRTTHRKSVEGHRTMLMVCQPKPTFARNPSAGKWFEDADRLAENAIYCGEDIYAERDLDDTLPELPPMEREIWLQIERCNRRGLALDADLLNAMGPLVAGEDERVLAELRALVGDVETFLTSPAKVRDFCAGRGAHLPNLQRDTVLATLDAHRAGRRLIDPVVVKVLEGRQIVGKSSNAKIPAMQGRLQPDGFARDYAIYHGAHTGRQTGAAVNPLNLPKPYKGYDQEKVVSQILRGDLAGMAKDRVSPTLAVSASLRGVIVAPPGKQLVIGDYSVIEPCVTFTLAGQWDAVKILRDKGDIYCEMASSVYRRAVTKEYKAERALGKALVLGCFGPGTKVLTSNGIKRITDVSIVDMVWDGIEWVSHRGCQSRGIRPVMNLAGIDVTTDHLVLCGSTWRQAITCLEESTLLRALETGSANLPSAVFLSPGEEGSKEFWSDALVERRNTSSIPTISISGRAPAAMSARNWHRANGRSTIGDTRTYAPMTRTVHGFSIESLRYSVGAKIRAVVTFTTTVAVGSKLVQSLKTAGSFFATFFRSLVGTSPNWNWTGATMSVGMSRGTFVSSPAAKTCSTEDLSGACRKRCQTYDLAFAGPRNRFTVVTDAGPLIVHNCGYGLGADMFFVRVQLDPDLSKVDEGLVRDAHAGYRVRFPKIKDLWDGIEAAAKAAIRNPNRRFAYGVISYIFDGWWLVATLPNGRSLFYPNARLQPGKYTDELVYEGRTKAGGWGDVRTWGGSLVENLAQSISRDITMEDKLELERRYGWHVPLDVYDEIVAEADEADQHAKEKLEAVMCRARPWLPEVPVSAECFAAKRYEKR